MKSTRVVAKLETELLLSFILLEHLFRKLIEVRCIGNDVLIHYSVL